MSKSLRRASSRELLPDTCGARLPHQRNENSFGVQRVNEPAFRIVKGGFHHEVEHVAFPIACHQGVVFYCGKDKLTSVATVAIFTTSLFFCAAGAAGSNPLETWSKRRERERKRISSRGARRRLNASSGEIAGSPAALPPTLISGKRCPAPLHLCFPFSAIHFIFFSLHREFSLLGFFSWPHRIITKSVHLDITVSPPWTERARTRDHATLHLLFSREL